MENEMRPIGLNVNLIMFKIRLRSRESKYAHTINEIFEKRSIIDLIDDFRLIPLNNLSVINCGHKLRFKTGINGDRKQ